MLLWGPLLAGAAQQQSGAGAEGAASITLDALTVSAAGTLPITAAASPTLAALTTNAAGALALRADLAVTLGALTLSAEGNADTPEHQYTEAEIAFGFFGFFDLTNTGNTRRIWHIDSSTWTGYITGSEATLACGPSGTPLTISVDGGAETSPAISSGQITLFSGLSDTPHLVRIRGQSLTSGIAYTPRTGTLLTVTGADPAVGQGDDLGTAWIVTEPTFPGMDSHTQDTRPGGVNVTPDIPTTAYNLPSSYSNSGATQFRARCSDIWIFSGDPEAWIGIDDGVLTKAALTPDFGLLRGWKKVATGLDDSAEHDYTVVGSNPASQPRSMLGVMIGDSTASFGTLSARKRFHMFGDSITFGAGAYAGQGTGSTDIYKVGAGLTVMPGASGKSGVNSVTFEADVPMVLAALPYVPDVGIIAIGRNDNVTSEANFKAAYESTIDQMLAFGMPRVLCRGIIPDPSNVLLEKTEWISEVVAAMADPRVVFIPVSSWTGVEAPDTTHPTEDGYQTLAEYEILAFAPFATDLSGESAGVLAPLTLAAAGQLSLQASGSLVLADLSVGAQAVLQLRGAIVVTLDDLSLVAAGAEDVPVPIVYARIPSGAVPAYRRERPAALSTARRRN